MPDTKTTAEIHAERHDRSTKMVQKRLDLPPDLDRQFVEWIYRVKVEENRTISQAGVLRGLVQLLIADPEVERRLRQHVGLPVAGVTDEVSDTARNRRRAGLPDALD